MTIGVSAATAAGQGCSARSSRDHHVRACRPPRRPRRPPVQPVSGAEARRGRHLAELGALCRAGAVDRAIDLAFEHIAQFGPDDSVVALLEAALDAAGGNGAARLRLAGLRDWSR